MARLRTLKPGFFLNEELARLPAVGRLLFAGLWCVADRRGRLEDRPARIKAEVLPYDDCDVDALLAELVDAGFVQRYSVDGKRCIQIVNFERHQTPHIKEAESTIPAPCLSGENTLLAPPVIGNQLLGSGYLSLGSGGVGAEAAAAAAPQVPELQQLDEVEVLFDHYKARIQPLARVRPDSKIRARLKRWTVPELVSAIDHFAAAEWWMTTCSNKGADWFFKSDSHVEQFVNMAAERSNGRTNGHARGGGAASAGPDVELYREAERRDRERQEATARIWEERERTEALARSAPPDTS